LVNALSDLFHESAPIEMIDHVFAIMALAPRHIFQILTKRPKIMQTYIADKATPGRITHAIDEIAPDANAHAIVAWPLPNVWLVSRPKIKRRPSAASRFCSRRPPRCVGSPPSLCLSRST
jgi:protein gp37